MVVVVVHGGGGGGGGVVVVVVHGGGGGGAMPCLLCKSHRDLDTAWPSDLFKSIGVIALPVMEATMSLS